MTRMTSRLTLGYSILAGPVLWFVHFIAVYSLAEFGCRANFNNVLFFPPTTIQIIIVGLTVVALVLVGAAALSAYRTWQAVRYNATSPDSSHYDFLALMGVFLSTLFLLTILLTAMPTFFLSVCDKVA